VQLRAVRGHIARVREHLGPRGHERVAT
jgi:hypothetical protein